MKKRGVPKWILKLFGISDILSATDQSFFVVTGIVIVLLALSLIFVISDMPSIAEPLFIAGVVITSVLLVLSLIHESLSGGGG